MTSSEIVKKLDLAMARAHKLLGFGHDPLLELLIEDLRHLRIVALARWPLTQQEVLGTTIEDQCQVLKNPSLPSAETSAASRQNYRLIYAGTPNFERNPLSYQYQHRQIESLRGRKKAW